MDLMSFSNFVFPKKKFVSLHLDKTSVSNMQLWCSSNNFDTTKNFDGNPVDVFKFHLTIFYTNNEVRAQNLDMIISKIPIKFSNMALFGKEFNTPVLKVVPTLQLKELRNRFEQLGFTDEWDEWKPHVTVSYNYSGTAEALESIELPLFDVYADRLVVKDQS